MNQILVVEDEEVLRGELKRLLERSGYRVVEAWDMASALAVELNDVDLVLSDIRLPGGSGDALLPHLKGVPLVLMTAFGSVRSAVHAIKGGAVDYLSKPFEPNELLQVIKRALSEKGPEKRTSAPPAPPSTAPSAKAPNARLVERLDRAMLGESPGIKAVKRQIAKVAPTSATVLVLGESGTGKELVARAIHESSPRSAGPFVPVNCASIPEGLIESELFGHARGSFTGAVGDAPGLVRAAHQGTLFLDEIGELPLSAQARLLRVLQEREVRKVGAPRATPVDVRVVAATHQNLPAMQEQGTFRQDLYYRLRVFEVHLPPLRERGNDVVLLARALLQRAAKRLGQESPVLSDDALQQLAHAPFPGNVRELENALQRALILHEEGPITAELLGLAETTPGTVVAEATDDPSLDGYFRRYVLAHQDLLSETELAERLGLSRKGLWEKRHRLGLPRRPRRAGYPK